MGVGRGVAVGRWVGLGKGVDVGRRVGFGRGVGVGDNVGVDLGVGAGVGCGVGFGRGVGVGDNVGVGPGIGVLVGRVVGSAIIGDMVGVGVGLGLGVGVGLKNGAGVGETSATGASASSTPEGSTATHPSEPKTTITATAMAPTRILASLFVGLGPCIPRPWIDAPRALQSGIFLTVGNPGMIFPWSSNQYSHSALGASVWPRGWAAMRTTLHPRSSSQSCSFTSQVSWDGFHPRSPGRCFWA